MMQDIQRDPIARDPIAVIGIGCRFPRAANPQAFWQLLSEGRNAIREVPAERWPVDDIYDPEPGQPGKTVSRWGGFLDQIDQFDWRAFRLLPREVKQMDPQQRLLLEVAWEALEDAGIPFEQIAGSNTGVSIGISWNDYLRLLTRNPLQIDGYTAIGNALCFAANRLSYIFDFKGPSMSIDAGCTSSLMSVYQACQSLWHGEADLALAGGVNLMLSPELSIMLSQADFLSHDGQCKTLDTRADGFVRGEGAGIVVLKPLSQVKESDRVYALIRGVATNHNGHNEWIVASSRTAQEALLRAAYARAGVDPAEVDYIELHGTGFLQGDEIEARALGAVLSRNNERTDPCLIGSVKTNIGHLEAAAGIASLIKVALSLYHRQIPPILNLQATNPGISLQSLRLAVPQATTAWPEKERAGLAGVSALSMSGVNMHAVLAGYPARAVVATREPAVGLLAVSACSADALVAQVAALRDFLSTVDATQNADWQDICYTATVRRTHHAYRLAVTAFSVQEAARALSACLQEPRVGRPDPRRRKLVFLCTRQSGSASSLLEDAYLLKNPAFRAVFQACDRVVRRLTQRSLAEIVSTSSEADGGQHHINEILHALYQIALADLWRSWNILPAAVLGEGLGEIAAAYIAGALTLEDALYLLFDAGEHAALSQWRNAAWRIHRLPTTPTCSWYSTMPDALAAEEDVDVRAWSRQLPGSQIADRLLDQVLADNHELFLDLGLPSALAARIAARFQGEQGVATFLSSFSLQKDRASTLLETLAAFYMQGHDIHWSALYPDEERVCVSLPTYQWQRERLWPTWLDNAESATSPADRGAAASARSSEGREMQPQDRHAPIATTAVPFSGTEFEQRLLHVWRELLGIDQIEPHDNFFALGGSSLLVSQLLARLHRLFGVRLSTTTIFEHPTVVELAEIIKQSDGSTSDEPIGTGEKSGQQYDEQLLAIVDQLTNEEVTALAGRRETLARLLRAKISGQKIFPLSFAQRRLWFLNQLQSGSPVYHVIVAFRIKEELDSKALEKSLNEIVRRHETLRTTFPAIDGQPLQMIAPSLTIEPGREDLETLPTEQRAAEVLRRATEQIRKPFDLEEGPLMRTTLLRLSASEHVLLLNVHHIIFDGWSMGIFYRELAALYAASVQGKPSPLSELPIQYIDYTIWEHKKLQGQALEASLAYWKQQLAGAPPALDLPTDYPRPPLETFRGAYEAYVLPLDLLTGLKALAQREKVTLFMTLLAAFQVVLAHESQQHDIVVGTDVANRSQIEVESLIGFFVNQLVLRTNLSGSPALSELLQRVRGVVLEAYDHQHVPFDQLVRALNPIRFPNRAPVFQVKIVLQNMPMLPVEPSITVDPLLVDAEAAQLDLILDLTETAQGLRVTWQYNTDLFAVSSINRLNQHLSATLQAFVASSSHTLSSLNALLDQIDGQQRPVVPGACVGGGQEPLRSGSLAQALEEQARRTPENIALVMQEREITYAQLNAQANRLAHRLKSLGVQPETMVVLCTERSLETIVGFFGIFKAGGVCVSLDPAYPKDRWSFILQDSRSKVVVTQSKLAGTFSEYGLEVVNLDRIDAVEEAENLSGALAPEQLAYVMYTSGSTGRPKGVCVSHQAIFNHCMAMVREFRLDEQDRILQFYSLAFDGALEQVFPGLLCGATIVMRGPTTWSVAELNTAVIAQKLTVVNMTPALWQQWSQEMLKEPATMRDARLRLIIVGAEAMTPEALRCWQKTPLATRPLINAYGPTEAVITAITFDVPEQFCPQEQGCYTVPIGRPLPYRTVYILNAHGKPVGPGTTGELYIGGPLLARGYLNRPDLTAERFIPDAFSAVPGSRLYRTGDLARYLPGGAIEYAGRVDQQVKVRGFRIELGEIETVLEQHPEVQTAIVMAREDHPGEKRLVAYILFQQRPSVTLPELRCFLEDRLPAYMIPATFLCLDTLPLTANGKVDRRSLPAPEAFQPKAAETFVAPRNPTEEMLAKIWSEVLAVEPVGMHDNFFESGGHSLSAIQVIARVRSTFQVDLPVHMLFLEPTVAKFAAKVVEAQGTSQEPALPAITRRRRDASNSQPVSEQAGQAKAVTSNRWQ